MNQEYFSHWSDMAKKAQGPVGDMLRLNVETARSMKYLKPEEFAHVRKPEEFLEKQVELAIENGHKALDYFQKSFYILEKAMLSCVEEVKNKTEMKMKTDKSDKKS